jgi:hypothetical protein
MRKSNAAVTFEADSFAIGRHGTSKAESAIRAVPNCLDQLI